MASEAFDGLGMHLGNLSRLSSAETRSISAENPTGAKRAGAMAVEGHGASHARDLGPGWKIAPAIDLPPRSTVTLAEIDGPGAIQHIWLTVNENAWRSTILRFYWDDEPTPSIESPLGDFSCCGWGEGEVKFYLDGDREYPTICGTGTEDYFGGAWCFDDGTGTYATYSTTTPSGVPSAMSGPGSRTGDHY